MAGLTAVDGATIISTPDYELLGFGAKITTRPGIRAPVALVTVTEPIVGGTAESSRPRCLGGTRHLSAAQFVHDQQDAIALVASQDRHFTVFAWLPHAKGWCTGIGSKRSCSDPSKFFFFFFFF